MQKSGCYSFKIGLVREVALKLWITCGTFSVGVNTFFGALKGGANTFFIIEEGGANINLTDKNLVSRSWINWLQEVEHPDHLLCKADDWNHLFRDAWSSGFKNRMIRITRFMNAMNSLTSLDHQLHKARSSSFTKKSDKQSQKSHYCLIVGLQGGQPFFQHQLGGGKHFFNQR